MDDSLLILCGTAASIGFLHTLLGPDHYLPFVAMARARNWSLSKTLVITVACGLGHVLSSVVLGSIGIALGVGVFRLESIESFRGNVAGWALLAFGLVYFIWGLRRALRGLPHTHWHEHTDGTVHNHEHTHIRDHAHVHEQPSRAHNTRNAAPQRTSLTPWVLFTVFLLGPCEPLIPLLMYPAAAGNLLSVLIVSLIFGLVTIATMSIIVAVAVFGAGAFRFPRLERFAHATAGFVILLCGLALQIGL